MMPNQSLVQYQTILSMDCAVIFDGNMSLFEIHFVLSMLVDGVAVVVKGFEFIDPALVINEDILLLFLKFLELLVVAGDNIDKAIIQ